MFSTLSKTKIIILANFILSSAIDFNLDQFRILSFGKELTLYKTTQFLDLPKLKVFAHNKSNDTQKMKFVFEQGRNQCWKKRKCYIPEFSQFYTTFSKAFFVRLITNLDCIVKGWGLPSATPFVYIVINFHFFERLSNKSILCNFCI